MAIGGWLTLLGGIYAGGLDPSPEDYNTLRTVMAVAEAYPELRSSDQFLELQGQLEGTENRINVARMRFNEAVRAYNSAIRYLPGSLVASLGNFHRKAYFQSSEEAKLVPALAFQ